MRQQITKNKMWYVIILLIFIGSCKKEFLELQNPTSLSPEQALTTEADMEVAIRGAYAGMRSTNNLGRNIVVIGDLLADNAYTAVDATRFTYGNTLSWTTANSDFLNIWTTSYSVILRANNIINSAITGGNINQIKGEAYAIRALNYFNLVRFFAGPYSDNPSGLGVPIVTEYAPFVYPARDSISKVYRLINDDLNQAYTLMTKFTNSGFFSKYAAKALQAKVYMTMGDKTNAKAAALDVINNSGFTLVSAAGYKTYWENPAVRTDKVETLFEISADAVSNGGFEDLAGIYTQGSGYGDVLSVRELYDLFSPTDERKKLYTPGTRAGAPAVFVNKYPKTTGDRSDTKVLRLSEMYLIVAEAPENDTEARTYINAITSRRNADAITSSGTALMEDVILERRKELAFEGDRWHDLNRLKRDINRGPEYPATSRSIPFTSFRRLLPIPNSEIVANPNIRLQQNPGYQ